MAGEDPDERDRLRFTLRRLRQEEEEEEEQQPELPRRNNAGERENDDSIEGAPPPPRPLLFQLSQSMDQMDNMFELTPSTTDTPSSSFDNNPPLPSASTSDNTLSPSLPSTSNSASRGGHGPIFDIASFMEESRERREARDREETEAAEENVLRLRTIRQTMVVPGESTSSPSSDQLSEAEWSSSTRRRRRRRSATCSDDQIVSDDPHPLSITHSHTLREAALSCPSTTDSEPDQLIPGTKYESSKNQRVPTLKKHVLENQRREAEQAQEKMSSRTKLKSISPSSSQECRNTGSSDYIGSAQSGLSCSLESTSSATVQEPDEEGSQDADCTLNRSHGLFKFKGRIISKFDNNTDNREPITDTEIIDSDVTIAEEGTQDLFSVNNDANIDSQYERTNTIPRWMLQQQKEQESEQTDLEELTEETQRGEKRSRLDSSPSSGTDPALSPTMKPPTKRPAGQIQSDSSSNSNESTGGSKGLKIAVTTTSIKSPTSSIELSSSYSQSITSTLQSVSSGYMPSGSSLTSSSDVLSSPSLSTPPFNLPCVGPVTDSEGNTTDLNFTIMSKGLSDFDTTATSSNSNNNNNDKEMTTTTNTNSSSSDSSSDGKDDNAKDKRGGREGERDDNGGRGGGGGSNEKGDRSGQHKEQTSDQNDRENKETKIVEESELGNDDQGRSGDGLRQLPSLNMEEDTATTANDTTNEQLKLLKGRADNSIITIDDTNNDKDESELTESLTNDSCIVIQKESLIDLLQPSLTIDSPNLPFSPEREERTHSTETGSIHSPALLANDSRIDSAHTLEGNCTDTSVGTQNSFRLHVSPSQSAIGPDDDDTDVFVIGSSTESTKGNVLSHSPLKLSSHSIPSTTPSVPSHSIPSTTPPVPSHSIPSTTPLVPSHSIPSTTPPVPMYESLQLSNTEVSSTSSMILSTSPASNVIVTSQADVSQTNSSGTFDFRLPDSDMLLPTGGGTNEAHVEDMETDTGDNDQSTKEQAWGNGVAETKGRSPGKCLSLRRRRSMSSGENTPKKLKQDQSTTKATDPLQSDTTIDPTTNGVRNEQGNKEKNGCGTVYEGETRSTDKTRSGGTLAFKSSARPTASLHSTTPGFILGLMEEEGDNGDTFNDTCSSHFELPPISALNSESEISPSDISFTKTDGACATTSTGPSLPLAVPSSLFAGLQHTRRKDTRRSDPYEFQEEDSNTDTPLFMPLRRRQEPETTLNSTMENENPLPLSTTEADTQATAESEKDGETATVTSTPVRRENYVVSGSTSQAQIQELVNASTPLTVPSNVSTIASPPMSSLHFVSPITCLTPQGVKDICSSNPYSPLIRLRHSTTVITSHVFIRDEIIDRNTEKVIQTLDHVVGPSEERKVSIEATPLSSAHILNPIPAQQLSSSYVSTTGIPCPASVQSTSSISHNPVNVSTMNSLVYTQQLGQSISPLSAAASSHVVNSSCTENHPTPSTSIISSEARSQSTTPTGRIRAHSPLRSQSLDLDSLPSTSQCTTSSLVVKNKSHQSGFKLVENQKVIARWKDGKWYAATIVEVSPIKAYLHFYDGDYSSVSVQHILPLACIPQGVQVSSSDADISGSLLDFSIPDSNFRMKLSNDTIMKCSLEDLVMTADTAEMTLQLLNTQSKQVVKKRKKSVSRRPEKESLSRKESILFSGMVFLVTDQRSSQPTGREEIEQILKDRGGYIMDEYKPNLVIDNRTFCLSNTYCRTLKYLTAIAASLPCVSYEWIMECVKQGKIVSWEKEFSLFAGVSPSTKQLIKWKSHTKGFLKVNVFLSGNRTFKEIWQKVISCGGGHVINKLPRKSSKESQFTIVSESSSIPASLKDFLTVSPDWLVECLLAGKVVSPEPFKRS